MSTDFWLWLGVIIVVVGGGGFIVVDRLEVRRARRRHEADRQARLKRELRQSLAHMAPPVQRRNGGDRVS
jgi:hypothetical protein